MPQRHPNTITSTSQPNPCLSHAPNSWIRRSIHESSRLLLQAMYPVCADVGYADNNLRAGHGPAFRRVIHRRQGTTKIGGLYLTWPSHYADGFLAAHTLISEFVKAELIGWLGGNNAHTSVSAGGTYTCRANMADRFEFISSRHDIAPRWLDR